MNDLRFAVRQLFKNPGFAALAILTLALGIGANTAMFSLVNGVLLKPLPLKDSDRLVALFQNHREQGQDFVELTAPDFVNWRDQNRAFEDLAAYQAGGFDLTGAGDPVRVSLMEESVSRQRFQMVLLFVFSIVALMLAVIGIYGVTACTVVRRYHEIGVRMSLGAQRRQILGLVLGQGMRPAFAGLMFGLMAAFALARLLQGLLFEIKASDPLTFSIVPGLLLMAAFAGCWLPVRRALKISPAVALRNE